MTLPTVRALSRPSITGTLAFDGIANPPDKDATITVERAASDGRREVPAPALRETADIWFDTGRDPVVTWDEDGRTFELVDPGARELRLTLLTRQTAGTNPRHLAEVLADGLAACDFPPTGDGASPSHVARALRAAGIDPDQP